MSRGVGIATWRCLLATAPAGSDQATEGDDINSADTAPADATGAAVDDSASDAAKGASDATGLPTCVTDIDCDGNDDGNHCNGVWFCDTSKQQSALR